MICVTPRIAADGNGELEQSDELSSVRGRCEAV